MKLTFKILASLLCLVAASCASDPSPFDVETPSQGTPSQGKEDAEAFLTLTFDVADSQETRAEGDELKSNSKEKNISSVYVYIFDSNGNIEDGPIEFLGLNFNGVGTVNQKIQVSTGEKTIYAIARGLTNPSVQVDKCETIDELEAVTFSSELDHITYLNEGSTFVMIGKSQPTQISKGDNSLTLTMTRAAAKAQVVRGNGSITLGNLSFGGAWYRALQNAKRMKIITPENDINDVSEAIDGTYNGYITSNDEYKAAVDAFDYTGTCVYMAENIMSNPVSGNTTFISVRIQVTPEYVYTYSEYAFDGVTGNKRFDGTDFYAIGTTDESTAINTYYYHGDDKQPMIFDNKAGAENYCKYLKDNHGKQYSAIEFPGKYVYYRINIKHGDENKVIRNTFYKITLEGVNGLGYHKEVIPTNPETPLEASKSMSLEIQAEDWNGQEMPVTLE